jgi:hypothetical protein
LIVGVPVDVWGTLLAIKYNLVWLMTFVSYLRAVLTDPGFMAKGIKSS